MVLFIYRLFSLIKLNMTEEYSIKTTINGPSIQTNVITGKFNSDSESRSIGFQGALMETLEFAIQSVVNSSFDIGAIPKLGKPNEYLVEPDDILVSYANNNDYFIFRGNSSNPNDREVFFRTINLPETSYRPGDPGSLSDFNFISGKSGIEYILTYNDPNNFTIKDNKGRNLVYNGSEATFDEDILVRNEPGMGVITYKQDNYTEVGITIFPSDLPSDQTTLPVAEGVKGFFYTESGLGHTDLSNYIKSRGTNLFTRTQRNFVSNFVQNSFLVFRNSVRHIIRYYNREYFSTNNKISTSTTFGNIKVEISIS